MKVSDYRLGFVGFGHMAQVIFEAIDRAKLVPRSHILFRQRDAAKMGRNEAKYGISSSSLSHLIQQSDLLLLCVRPQQVRLALDELAAAGQLKNKWIVSILAGTKIEFFQNRLGSGAQILRAMPNIASAVSEGMTILTYSQSCSAEFRAFGNLLFGSMGEIAELDEALADIATGMAGSGPGFVFRLIEAKARLGEKRGIPYAVALKIAAQAFAGSARLILRGEKPSDLIQSIATPQGVTQAGFDEMTKREIDAHFQAVIEAAARRAGELSES